MKNKLTTLINTPYLVCLTVLLLNDFYLKTEYHNWLTGKLSDLCGLFVFASLWAALLPNKKITVYLSVTLSFVVWKSPYSQSFIDFFGQSLYPIDRVVDVTDLVALTILPIAFYNKPYPNGRVKVHPYPIALLTLFSICATSVPEPRQVFEQPQYLLFKPGIVTINSSDYPSDYDVYDFDTLVIISIKSIGIDKRATIDDEFHKVQILKDIDLRLLRELKEGYSTQGKLAEYKGLRDSLMERGATSLTLKLDSIRDELNFRKGRLDGDFKRYSGEHRLVIEGKYKNGIEDSTWIFYNSQNEIISKKYFQNGELIKTDTFKKSKLISEQKLNTRDETLRNKYFHLAILSVIIFSLLLKLYYNLKASDNKSFVQLSNFSRIVASLFLPLCVLLLSEIFSSFIPNSYTLPFLGVFIKLILAYIMTVPIFLIIFYSLKLRSRFDLIYYILFLSLIIVLTEEWINIKNIL